MITRRNFIVVTAAGLCIIAMPGALAQQRKIRRIGFLGSSSAPGYGPQVEALRAGLRDLGYVDGKNIVIEFRWADGKYERLPELAAELVRLPVDVIVTHGTPAALACKQATTTIPIVMAAAGDVAISGIVASIARPGGNITGSTFYNLELAAKRLELLKEILPHMQRAAVLINAANPGMEPVLKTMEPVAKALKLELQQAGVRGPEEFERALSSMAAGHIDAVVVLEDGMLNANIRKIVELAGAKRLPVIGLPELAEAGGLMAYGVDQLQMFRRAAYFVDRIFKGTKAGDIPIERATKFETILNLKTAKALGIKFPQSVLVRADKVIE